MPRGHASVLPPEANFASLEHDERMLTKNTFLEAKCKKEGSRHRVLALFATAGPGGRRREATDSWLCRDQLFPC